MGEPARKLHPEDDQGPSVPPAGPRGRVIRLPLETRPSAEEDEAAAWVLRAIMECYCSPR